MKKKIITKNEIRKKKMLKWNKKKQRKASEERQLIKLNGVESCLLINVFKAKGESWIKTIMMIMKGNTQIVKVMR